MQEVRRTQYLAGIGLFSRGLILFGPALILLGDPSSFSKQQFRDWEGTSVYLISVEGRRSGKGEAVRLLNEILAKYPFADVCHEPRRHADAGRRALEAVQRGDMTPAEEAALFAEAGDHTKSWILPVSNAAQW